MRRLGSRGDGKLGCIVWGLFLGVAILITMKAVPVKLNDVEFGDFIEEQAQFSGRVAGDSLRERILNKAKELKIPLDPKKLKVEKSARRVKIQCSYSVTLDFGFYQYEWEFEHDLDRPIFVV